MKTFSDKIYIFALTAILSINFFSLHANTISSLIDSAKADYFKGRFQTLSDRVNRILKLQDPVYSVR